MRLLLINPPRSSIDDIENAIDTIAPPIGLAYLAAVLERAGYDVKIIDAPAISMNFKSLRYELSRLKPDVVGITATTPYIFDAIETAKIAKMEIPDCVTILGGPHPTLMPVETLSNPYVDIVCIGEGEKTIVELANALEMYGMDKLSDIKGIAYKHDGKPIINEPRPLIEDLDSLPFPARHLLPMNMYKAFGKRIPIGSILTSRGCPFKCIFCASSKIWGKKFRARSPRNVVDEIEEFISKYRSKYIEFIDDIFTLSKKRTIEICKEIKSRGLDIFWGCSSRVDTVTKEILAIMKSAGCFIIYFGVESGVQRILDKLAKGIKLEQIKKAFRWAKEVGIQTLASVMIGAPGESLEDIQRTLKFVKKLDPDFVQFSILTPYPGTEIYEELKKQGYELDNDWRNYSGTRPTIKGKDMDPDEIIKIFKKAYVQFYMNPRKLISYLAKGSGLVVLNIMRKFFVSRIRNIVRKI